MCLSPTAGKGSRNMTSYYKEKSSKQNQKNNTNKEKQKNTRKIKNSVRKQESTSNSKKNIFKKINQNIHSNNNSKINKRSQFSSNDTTSSNINTHKNISEINKNFRDTESFLQGIKSVIIKQPSDILIKSNNNEKIIDTGKKFVKKIRTTNHARNTENIKYINLNPELIMSKIKDKYPINKREIDNKSTKCYNYNDISKNFHKSFNYINTNKISGNLFYKNNSNNSFLFNSNTSKIKKSDISKTNSQYMNSRYTENKMIKTDSRINEMKDFNFILNLRKLKESKSDKNYNSNNIISCSKINNMFNNFLSPQNISRKELLKNHSYVHCNSSSDVNNGCNLNMNIQKKQSLGGIGINNNIIEHIQINLFNNKKNKSKTHKNSDEDIFNHIKYTSDKLTDEQKIKQIYLKIDNRRESYKKKLNKKSKSKQRSLIDERESRLKTNNNEKNERDDIYYDLDKIEMDKNKYKSNVNFKNERDVDTPEEAHFYTIYHIQKIKNKLFN